MGLVTKTKTAVATNAHGKPIKSYGIKDANGKVIKKIEYSFSWNEYEDDQTMVDAKDEMTLKEQRLTRNIERKTKARQAANTAATLAVGIAKPNEQSDSQLRLRAVYKGKYAKLIADGMSPEDAHIKARQMASDFLEEEWTDTPEEDEDDE